jgi:integrase
MSNSSKASRSGKRPPKPYPEFPLYPHRLGYWARKVRGKTHFFGRWGRVVDGKLTRVEGDGWREALEAHRVQIDDLKAGRTPRVQGDGATVAHVCNHFLTAKLRKVEAGELGARAFEEYRQTTDLLVASFGANRLVDDLAADDFGALRTQMAKRWGPVRLGNAITRVKGVFKYAVENRLIDRPAHFGTEFKKPGKAVLRRHRATNGGRMFEAAELRKLIDAAGPTMRAMIFLGVNCGFGNADCGSLQFANVNLESAWVDFPRPKTGIPRRCPLWPETVAAVRESLESRPKPATYAECGQVFLTVRGSAFVRTTGKSRTDLVAVRFARVLKAAGLYREGVGFYTLRHVFRTVADGARDPVAIDLIMGHADPSMGAHYRERVEDARLVAVASHVRTWLLAGKAV